MPNFPHLKLKEVLTGKPRSGIPPWSDRTEEHKKDRHIHHNNLKTSTNKLETDWKLNVEARKQDSDIPYLDPDIVPMYLNIDTSILYKDHLDQLGIEIISEDEEGFIIGASFDGLRSLKEKIDGFLVKEHGSAIVAQLWDIKVGTQWRPERILSSYLLNIWKDIQDTDQFTLDIGVAYKSFRKPKPHSNARQTTIDRYNLHLEQLDEERRQRESDFEKFILNYGVLLSSLIDCNDSFSCRIGITGKGLKDLVLNYPFVFEIKEVDLLEELHESDNSNIELLENPSNIEIIDAEEISILDSGIMENHPFIQNAIFSSKSKSYLQSDSSSADYGGHGTKVAGVVLYSKNFSEAPTNFIRNLRILDQSNNLENNFPAELIKKIIEENLDCRIFNLSINSEGPCRTKHISSWAAQLDLLSNEYNSIFVISIGNLSTEFINNYISGNVSYPEYLNENVCRIANPSQSMFAISVGSYNTVKFEDEDFLSIEDTEQISSFSRSGLGMWGSIKPTVVESGGGLQQSKSFPFHVHRKAETSITTLKSSLNSPGLISKNEIGTSFAAGFVSNLVGKIANLYKDEHSNIIKALLVQSARLPLNHFYNPSLISIKHFGYGIPSESRALNNSPHRITFYNSGKISAYQGHIYEVRIPDNLVNQGDEFEVLLEFTLCYTAIVRRTRQKVKSYLSTWLDWDSSKLGESFSEFRLYTMNEIDSVAQDDYNKEQRKSLRGVPWMIQNRINSGINGLIRSDNAIQKDWAIIKAFDLPDAISFAIKAHKGWDNKLLPIEYAITFSIEILGQEIPIYNEIAIENDLEVEI